MIIECSNIHIPLMVFQGFWMGIFTTCGGLSRVIGPIGTSTIYQHYGTYATYGAILVVLAIALIMASISFKSFKMREPAKSGSISNASTVEYQCSKDTSKKY